MIPEPLAAMVRDLYGRTQEELEGLARAFETESKAARTLDRAGFMSMMGRACRAELGDGIGARASLERELDVLEGRVRLITEARGRRDVHA